MKCKQVIYIIFFFFSFQSIALAMEADAPQPFIGQWVWSSRDAKIFNDARRNVPDLVPSIWVSTISVSDGKIVQRLANVPDLIGRKSPVAVVIRFDDSFNSVWHTKKATYVAEELDERLYKLTGILTDTGITVREVQLDYDCPVRRLEDWSKVIYVLNKGSLKDRDVWITSLPSHIQVPGFGLWFSGCVTGHILQVFDTGVSCNRTNVERIAGLLRKQGVAFRLGLGAFERTKGTLSTNHRRWFSSLSAFSSIPGYRGLWVFPGGRQWDYLL